MSYNFRAASAYGVLKRSCEKYKNNTAASFQNRKITYAELLNNIEKTSIFLKKEGVKKGDIVTLALPNIPETIFIMYAVNKLGGILHLLHPLLKREAIEKNLEKTESEFLFLNEKIASVFKKTKSGKRT